MKQLLALVILGASSIILASDYGPPVGAPMPPLEALDQNGKLQTLNDILGPNGAALVFFRSADW
jgi:hypothetical protein